MTEPLFGLPQEKSSPGRPRTRVQVRLREAVLAGSHLESMDGAAVALALRLAADLDRIDLGSKDAATIGKALLDVLRDLHLTPRARRMIGETADLERDPDLEELHRMRKERFDADAGT